MRMSSCQTDAPRGLRADPELLESIPLVILCLNADQRVVYANPWASRVLGIPRDALQSEAFLEIHPDESELLREEFAQMVAIGDPVKVGPRTAEFRVRRADGEWRWLRAVAAAYRSADDDFRVVTMSEDITELRAIQRVHASEDGSSALFTIDLDENPPVIVGVDDEFERIAGQDKDELVGATVPELFARLYEPGQTEFLRLLGDVRLGHEGSVQVYWQSATGIDMRARVRFVPIVERARSTRFAVGLISQSGPISVEFAKSHARISDRLLALGRFAMGLSHELNNPLGSILLSSERALRSASDEQVGECLAEIIRDVRRCSDIVRSLYRFGRGEKASRTLCDVNQVVRRAIDSHREGDVPTRVRAMLVPDLPMLSLDVVGIEIALVNLIRNAHEASGFDGLVEVETVRVDDGIEIRVSDRGCGIRRDDRRYVFEPFFTTRTEEGGSGVGLSVVHGIVSSHRGAVQIEDREGGGTIVTVWLPREAANRGFDS